MVELKRRACGALIRNRKILMVKQAGGSRIFWTLPGGHVGEEESYEDAVVREVLEETGMKVTVNRLLFEGEAGRFHEKCFLLDESGRVEPALGEDPELRGREPSLKDVAWFPLEEKADDVQVARVIKCLS